MSETDAMVFVVDDDAPMRESLKNLIRSVGLQVELFASAQEFLRSKRPNLPSCLVLDVRLPGLSVLDLQKRTGEGVGGDTIPFFLPPGSGISTSGCGGDKSGGRGIFDQAFSRSGSARCD